MENHNAAFGEGQSPYVHVVAGAIWDVSFSLYAKVLFRTFDQTYAVVMSRRANAYVWI